MIEMGIQQIILGTLLGDASIYSDRTTFRLDISHGWKQRAYLEWKASLIGATQSISEYETGYGSIGYRIRYYNKEVLAPIAAMVLRNGVKTITQEWLDFLDDVSLALWYQDDGSWGSDGPREKNGDRRSRYITFSTEGFSVRSVGLLYEWLCSRGFAARIHKSKKKYDVISLNHSATMKFWGIVSPYIFIRSKIDMKKRPGIAYCKCGVCIEPKIGICSLCLQKIAKVQSRQRLIRRFGTSKLSVIQDMDVIVPSIPEYWVNPDRVGSAL
jgi:hypothetical protein